VGKIISIVVKIEFLNKIVRVVMGSSVFDSVSHSFIIYLCTDKIKLVTYPVCKFNVMCRMYNKTMTGHIKGKVVIEVT